MINFIKKIMAAYLEKNKKLNKCSWEKTVKLYRYIYKGKVCI